MIKIGINPITWSNDDLPELGGDTSLETCLLEARAAGYEGIELGNKFPRESKLLGPIMARHNLKLVSGWYSASLLTRSAEDEIKAVTPHLSLLKDMGCKVMVFAETSNAIHGDRSCPLSKRPVLKAEEWKEFGRRMTVVGDHLEKHGVKLAYHHHMGTCVQSAEDIDNLMTATGPSVGLLLDTGHAVFAGADPVAIAKKHMNRTVHVHCKDIRKSVMQRSLKEDWSFLDSVVNGTFTVPGDGMIDYDSVLSVVAKIGYDGWIVVEAEQDPAVAKPILYAHMGYTNLRDIAFRTGLLSTEDKAQRKRG